MSRMPRHGFSGSSCSSLAVLPVPSQRWIHFVRIVTLVCLSLCLAPSRASLNLNPSLNPDLYAKLRPNFNPTSRLSTPNVKCPSRLINNSCICPPEHYLDAGKCVKFEVTTGKFSDQMDLVGNVSVLYENTFSGGTFPYRRKLSQSTFILVTVVLIAVWLVVSCSIRMIPLGDGNEPGGGWRLKLRYEVSRLDRRYHRKHWLDEQKVLIKRRTVLGGICSVSSYIFMFGTLSGLTYQQFGGRLAPTQTLVPNFGADVANFNNDVFWNFTIISDMLCDQAFVVVARDSVLDNYRELDPLEIKAAYKCVDTVRGPRLEFSCVKCKVSSDFIFTTVVFQDFPGRPAAASGIEFSMQTSSEGGDIESRTDGVIKANLAYLRGPAASVLHWRLVPRNITDKKNGKILQALFHEYFPGSVMSEEELVADLSSGSGRVLDLVMTFFVEVASEYIVKSSSNTMSLSDILTWLAGMGGLYQLSITLFYLLQLQIEIRLRMFAYDEELLNMLHRVNRRRELWRKLRATMKTYHLLSNFGRYKALWEKEKKLLLEEVEKKKKEEEEKKRAQYAGGDKKKQGFYSGFLRRRRGNRGSGPEQSVVVEISPGTLTNGVKAESMSTTDENSPFLKPKEKDPLSLEHKSREPEKFHEEVVGGEGEGESVSDMLRKADKLMSRSQSAPERARKPEDEEQLEGVGEEEEDEESERERKDLEEKRRGFSGIFKKGGDLLQDAASSLHAAAHTVTQIPHVRPVFFSSQFEKTRPKETEEKEKEREREEDKRKKSKSYMKYGSNSIHKGMIVREWRKPSWLLTDENLPAAPCVEEMIEDEDPVDWEAIYRHAYGVYNYNRRLRDDFLALQTQMENTLQYFRPQSDL